jgi:hypothetical protein
MRKDESFRAQSSKGVLNEHVPSERDSEVFDVRYNNFFNVFNTSKIYIIIILLQPCELSVTLLIRLRELLKSAFAHSEDHELTPDGFISVSICLELYC